MKLVPLQKDSRTAPGAAGCDPRAPIGLRLRVRLHRAALDRQLSQGLAADAFEERALRARQLGDGETRRRLARVVRSLIADAELPAVARMCSAVPVSRRSVLPWRHALLGVAEWLERDEPVDPCGVARVMVLITDGCSPVYNPDAKHSMGDAIWWVADGLKLPGAAD
jgi:hypothetical protein